MPCLECGACVVAERTPVGTKPYKIKTVYERRADKLAFYIERLPLESIIFFASEIYDVVAPAIVGDGSEGVEGADIGFGAVYVPVEICPGTFVNILGCRKVGLKGIY